MEIQACIFDLDGVIVDTAKYHYLAWKRLAREKMDFDFLEADNEQLKGVSRIKSLEILLGLSGKTFPEQTREDLMALKNRWYLEYITKMTPNEILPGSVGFISDLKNEAIKIGLGSASKNAPFILEKIGLMALFDTVVDGNRVQKAKPDPEVFLLAADDLKIPPAGCVVFEDAQAGIDAARNGGMICVGVGSPKVLKGADLYVEGLHEMDMNKLKTLNK